MKLNGNFAFKVINGRLYRIVYRGDFSATIDTTDENFVFTSDYFDPIILKKDWFEKTTTLSDLAPYATSIANSAVGCKVTRKTDSYSIFEGNLREAIKNLVDSGFGTYDEYGDIYDMLNENKPVEDIEGALYDKDWEADEIGELSETWSPSFNAFLAILKRGRETAVENGLVKPYEPYDALMKRLEVIKHDTRRLYATLSDKEGRKVDDGVIVTALYPNKYFIEYYVDGEYKNATLGLVGDYPYLSRLKGDKVYDAK